MSSGVRVLIVDDEPAFRDGLVRLLAARDDLDIRGAVADGGAALTFLHDHIIDVVLLDVHLPDLNGLEVLRLIHARAPQVTVLMLTSLPNKQVVNRALDDGASGFIAKEAQPEQMAQAIHAAHAGQVVLGPKLRDLAFSWSTPLPDGLPGPQAFHACVESLSDPLRGTYEILVSGGTHEDIARTLHVATGTARNYTSQVFTRCGVRNRTELAILAHRYHAI